MKNILKIEGIPNIAAQIYSAIVQFSPLFKDLYNDVAEEVCAKISSGNILDIGTGPGYLPLKILNKNSDLKILGVDISPTMVKIARKNVKVLGAFNKVNFKLASAENLPFADEYFDLIISTASFHHWKNTTKCLNEIYRVLKKNSEVWIYDIRKDTPKEVNNKLKEKYGIFLSFIFLNIVRAHSSMKLKDVENIVDSAKTKFIKKTIEEKGLIFKLRLVK